MMTNSDFNIEKTIIKHQPLIVNDEPSLTNPVSQMAAEAQCRWDAFYYGCQETRLPHEPIFHRKRWEYAYILQCLSEAGMMSPGRRGLGFGVGQEPLVAVMAARGCSVVTTDLDSEEGTKQGWAGTGQYAATLEALNDRGICPPERFASKVSYRVADMNKIDPDLVGFDFVYSSCAFEHVGSIEQGLQFVKNSLKCLRPGAIAVHTTEFNVFSNEATIDHQQTVLVSTAGHRQTRSKVDKPRTRNSPQLQHRKRAIRSSHRRTALVGDTLKASVGTIGHNILGAAHSKGFID